MNQVHDLEVELWNGAKPTEYFLLDLSWLLHKYYHAMATLTYRNEKGETVRSGHYYGTLRLIQTIIQNYKAGVIVCVDSNPVSKRELDSEYKQGRLHTFSLKEVAIKTSRIASSIPGVLVAIEKGIEADEIMHSAAKKLERAGYTVYIMSGDNDLLQSVSDKIHVCRKVAKGKLDIVKENYALEKFGVGFKDLLFYRILTGDVSDNLPRVWSKKEAMLTIDCYKTLDNFMATFPFDDADVDHLLIKKNYELMTLKEVDFTLWKGDKEKAVDLAKQIQLNSFVRFIEDLSIKNIGVQVGF